MKRLISKHEEVIELLQKQTFEVFMDIMDKLISDNKWAENGDFILLITDKRGIVVDFIAFGIFNKSAGASQLEISCKEDFISIIDAVKKKMIRKYPAAKCQIKEVTDKLIFKLVRII